MPRWFPVLVALITGCNKNDPCDAFVSDATSCYDGYCGGSGDATAFCGCWNQGMDLSTVDCTCTTLDLSVACDEFDLSDYQAGDLDCAAATASLSNICPG